MNLMNNLGHSVNLETNQNQFTENDRLSAQSWGKSLL